MTSGISSSKFNKNLSLITIEVILQLKLASKSDWSTAWPCPQALHWFHYLLTFSV